VAAHEVVVGQRDHRARGRLRDEAAPREDALPLARGRARRGSAVPHGAGGGGGGRGRPSAAGPAPEVRRPEHGRGSEVRARPRRERAAQGPRGAREDGCRRVARDLGRRHQGRASPLEHAVALGSGLAQAVEGDGGRGARRARRPRRARGCRYTRGRGAHLVHLAGRAPLDQRARADRQADAACAGVARRALVAMRNRDVSALYRSWCAPKSCRSPAVSRSLSSSSCSRRPS
jgi:hypothetical protein